MNDISLDESIGYPTTTTSRNLIRFLFVHLREFDITPEQWTIMKRIAEHDGITQKELSQRADKDKATVTRIIDILIRKQHVRREMNGVDRRSVLLFITDQGRLRIEELRPYIEQLFEEKMLKGISEEALLIYKEVLSQINKNIADELDDMAITTN